jgi:hypothetical protein
VLGQIDYAEQQLKRMEKERDTMQTILDETQDEVEGWDELN